MLASREQLGPAENFDRRLEAQLDLAVVRAWVADQYAERGRPRIAPVVFFTLQLLLVVEGLRAERTLIETASLPLAHRGYRGSHRAEALPDHASLTRSRHRLGGAVLQRVCEHGVEWCQPTGLVWGKALFFDGTKVPANADSASRSPRCSEDANAPATAHVTVRFAAAAEAGSSGAAAPLDAAQPANAPAVGAAAVAAQAPAASTALPVAGTAAAQAPLAAAQAAQGKGLEERRLDPQRPPAGPYRRIIAFRGSTTAPAAAPIGGGAVAKLGYHAH